MEGFVEIEGFPNYFIAHSPPRVVRLVNGEYLECKQTPNSVKDNYWTVSLKDVNGVTKKRSVHRLLMLVFVPNPLNKAHVNHIDGDKSNNDMGNLEWATPKENAQHAIRMGLTDPYACNKEVHQYSLSGDYIASHCSGIAAQKNTGVEAANIRSCANGVRTVAGFFQWSYEKHDRISPCKKKYVHYYLYEGKKFSSYAELGKFLGMGNLDKLGIDFFDKATRDKITTVHRK